MGGTAGIRGPEGPGEAARGRAVLRNSGVLDRRGVERVLRFPLNALIDFLVEDSCAVCKRPRPHRRCGRRWVGKPARYLLEPVPVRCLLGALQVVNHPVCPGCAVDLEVARSSGALDLGAGVHSAAGSAQARRETDGTGGETDASRPPARRPVLVVSPFMTTDGVLEIIHQLKFNGYVGLAGPIGRTIGWALGRAEAGVGKADLVIPTPMDARSEKERGFNHAERIARSLAADLGAPLASGVLRKTVRTARQSRTPREMREKNVRGAFSCPGEVPSMVDGQRVVLVDDLVTSGATAAVCVNVLLAAGAAAVTVACFGRAL